METLYVSRLRLPAGRQRYDGAGRPESGKRDARMRASQRYNAFPQPEQGHSACMPFNACLTGRMGVRYPSEPDHFPGWRVSLLPVHSETRE
jgi:hypothetical protein